MCYRACNTTNRRFVAGIASAIAIDGDAGPNVARFTRNVGRDGAAPLSAAPRHAPDAFDSRVPCAANGPSDRSLAARDIGRHERQTTCCN